MKVQINHKYKYLKHKYVFQIFSSIFIVKLYIKYIFKFSISTLNIQFYINKKISQFCFKTLDLISDISKPNPYNMNRNNMNEIEIIYIYI